MTDSHLQNKVNWLQLFNLQFDKKPFKRPMECLNSCHSWHEMLLLGLGIAWGWGIMYTRDLGAVWKDKILNWKALNSESVLGASCSQGLVFRLSTYNITSKLPKILSKHFYLMLIFLYLSSDSPSQCCELWPLTPGSKTDELWTVFGWLPEI